MTRSRRTVLLLLLIALLPALAVVGRGLLGEAGGGRDAGVLADRVTARDSGVQGSIRPCGRGRF